MIKRYNQFVGQKLNEDLVEDAISVEGPVMRDNPLPIGEEEEETGEVEGKDANSWEKTYMSKIQELADLLPGSTISNNSVSYDKKTILYPSETFNINDDGVATGIFHVDKKKFDSAQKVADYLLKNQKTNSPGLPDGPEVTDNQAAQDLQKESKSYKSTRMFRKSK